MTTADAGLLTLTQWLSPAFPVGGYAYSHGLEAAISEGQVKGADGLKAWLEPVLTCGSGRADATLLCAAMEPGADIGALNLQARALAASRERWEETRDQGRAFCEAVEAVSGRAQAPVALPVAVGRAAGDLNLPKAQVAALYLQSFASNLISGAVRFMPLGQAEGQRILADLQGPILDVAAAAALADPGRITTGTPWADLSAMRHETLDVRIFRT